MNEIRIGILHSLSGTMASSERPLVDAALFSIDEINKKGGIIGKQLLGIVEDACSDPEIFRMKAEKLLEENDVNVLSGCWTSSSRKAVQEIIQDKNVFLLYPVQYEGLEENPNILYSGSCLNQQISPAIEWCLAQGHKNFYLVGSDYVFPKTANALIKSLILDHGANILGEDYLPLGATDFKDVTKSIKSALPDFVINTINGDSNAGFFTHYNKSENEFPVMSFSISENDLENLGIQSAPHYLCWSYFQNFDNKVNQRFIRDFSKYNKNHPIVSDPMVMTYSQIRLWSQAVEEAGSLDIEDIQAHIHGQKLNSPAGLLEVMHNNHILKFTFIGKQISDRKFEVIWKSDKRIKPKPWLGMEDVELPSAKLVLDALSQYPNLIHLNTELINTKRELEKADKELRIESGILEERVAERTKELQKSEAKYIDLYDNAPDMFVSIDAKTSKIIQCNQTVVSTLGYKKDEIIGQPMFFVYHPDYIEDVKKVFQQFVETGEVHDAELQLKRKDGSKMDVSLNVSAVRDEEGNVLYSRSIWRDITERKQAEAGKEQSQSLLKAALESTADGILVVTREGRWSSFNQKFIDIWGIPSSLWEANDDKAALEYVIDSLEEPDEFLTKVKELYADPEKDSFDIIKMKDGRIFERYSHPQWLNEEVVGRVWSFRDVTKRKRAEKQLHEITDRMQISIDHMPNAYILWDQDLRVVEWNKAAEDIFGYSKEEMLDKNPVDYIVPKPVRHLVKDVMRELKKGEVTDYSEKDNNIRKDGKLISCHWFNTPLTDKNGDIFGYLTIAQDITARLSAEQAGKQAEKALRESEEKFRGVIEQSNDGIYVLQDDRFVFINPRYTEIIGYKLEEISGKDFDFNTLIAEEGLMVLEEREKIRKQGGELPDRYIFKALRKDGQKRDLEVSVTTVDWQGEPATLGVAHDVTERIQNQKKLEKALEDAKQGVKVKSLFMANMSHEIRTPLNTILGFTGLIEESTRHIISEDERKFFKVISTSGQRLMHTVHEILDISLIDAGTYVMTIEDYNLVPVVQGLVDGMQIMAKEKQLILEFHSTHKQVLIRADRDGISQSINNLIDNAIKYTEKGKITLELRQKSKSAILTIQDTGIGMSEEYLNKIFEVFSQESEGYTKKYQGIGLGLAIVKGHLDLNHVNITVASTKGKGTTCTLTFPNPQQISYQQTEAKKSKQDEGLS